MSNTTLTAAEMTDQAEFLASCNAEERAEAEEMFRLIDEANANPRTEE